ncbi:MAG TPA: hypothetical protein VK616_07080 [Flavitalea sp.]|nr:hypothetical protein [Flavitalea sp.]
MVSGKARLIANEIIELYQNHGESAPDAAQVSQFEYLMQLAQTAEVMGYEEDIILAALLQDIGQFAVSAMVQENRKTMPKPVQITCAKKVSQKN